LGVLLVVSGGSGIRAGKELVRLRKKEIPSLIETRETLLLLYLLEGYPVSRAGVMAGYSRTYSEHRLHGKLKNPKFIHRAKEKYGLDVELIYHANQSIRLLHTLGLDTDW
jgi:hypothetical protein